MQATEFRVGNYVYVAYSGSYEKIRGIIEKEANLELYGCHYHGFLFKYPNVGNKVIEQENCEAILLTKETLQQSGFVKAEKHDPFGGFLIQLWEGYSLRLRWNENKWTFDYYGYEIRIKYVHQIQNLYFALAGEELNINFKQHEYDQKHT